MSYFNYKIIINICRCKSQGIQALGSKYNNLTKNIVSAE